MKKEALSGLPLEGRAPNGGLLGAVTAPGQLLAGSRHRSLGPVAMIAAILLAGGLVCRVVEQSISERLTARLLEDQRLAVERDVRRFDAGLQDAERSARRLADLISFRSAELPEKSSADAKALERGPDGSLRSRRESFQPVRDAAIRLPAGSAASGEKARLLRRAQEITRSYSQGGRPGPTANTWVLPLSGGHVIHWPDLPDYAFQPSAPTDAATALRVRHSSPGHSPEGHPRWTPPAYDPAARRWLISVVAPFYRDGRWAGAVGHDIVLSHLLDALEDRRSGAGGALTRALYVSDSEGRLLAGRHGLRSQEARLPESYRPFLEETLDGRGPRAFGGGADPVIVVPVPTLSAFAVYRVDGGALRGRVQESLAGLTIARNLGLAGLVAISIGWLGRERRLRLRLQSMGEDERRERQELVDAVGEELRTPLAILTGSLHRLQHQPPPLDPMQRKALDLAAAEVGRLRSLLDDLVVLSRSAHSHFNLRSVPVDAVRVLSHCCDQARSSLDRPVELVLPEATGEPSLIIRGDAERLRQVIGQLLETADHALPAERPIHVRVERANGWLHIGVQDLGSGTGLGLTVARMLTEAMGGRMGLEETVEAGSSAWLSFPLAATIAVLPRPAAALA